MKPAVPVNRLFVIVAASRRLSANLIVMGLILLPLGVKAQTSDHDDKPFDVRSSVGDLHVGKDADARRAGLPLYPGARLKGDDENSDRVNMGVATEAFGMKLVVAKYESDDPPARILDFYRDKLKKYGKVLECHGHSTKVNAADDKGGEDSKDKILKCDENDGPVTELKVGVEDNQHIVAVEPSQAGKGSNFTLVYIHTRGKQGDI